VHIKSYDALLKDNIDPSQKVMADYL